MKEICVLSDFDGTITKQDSLYTFFKEYAKDGWKEVEQLWLNNKINSKECLIREFGLVPDLNKELVDKYLKTVQIDDGFKAFHTFCKENDIDIFIASDGVDYFINTILKDNNIEGIKVISNHGEFKNEKFEVSFPNDSADCIIGAGTCKCKAAKKIKENYKKIIYIGDGASDYCVSNKADILFAKYFLENYCKKKNMKYIPFNTFNDVLSEVKVLQY